MPKMEVEKGVRTSNMSTGNEVIDVCYRFVDIDFGGIHEGTHRV